MKKSLSGQNKELKEEIKELKNIIKKLEDDRSKFREYFIRKLKWFIILHGKNETPSTDYLINDMSKFLNSVERWWW